MASQVQAASLLAADWPSMECSSIRIEDVQKGKKFSKDQPVVSKDDDKFPKDTEEGVKPEIENPSEQERSLALVPQMEEESSVESLCFSSQDEIKETSKSATSEMPDQSDVASIQLNTPPRVFDNIVFHTPTESATTKEQSVDQQATETSGTGKQSIEAHLGSAEEPPVERLSTPLQAAGDIFAVEFIGELGQVAVARHKAQLMRAKEVFAVEMHFHLKAKLSAEELTLVKAVLTELRPIIIEESLVERPLIVPEIRTVQSSVPNDRFEQITALAEGLIKRVLNEVFDQAEISDATVSIDFPFSDGTFDITGLHLAVSTTATETPPHRPILALEKRPKIEVGRESENWPDQPTIPQIFKANGAPSVEMSLTNAGIFDEVAASHQSSSSDEYFHRLIKTMNHLRCMPVAEQRAAQTLMCAECGYETRQPCMPEILTGFYKLKRNLLQQ